MTRRLLLAAWLLSLISTAAVAQEPNGALQRLSGHWRGGGMDVFIDFARSQARPDRDKPFQWVPLRIRNVTGNMVVFDLGKQRYIGLVEPSTLTLTSPHFAGHRVLARAN